MNVCAIGDPHGNLEKIKKIPLKDSGVDLILLTGDLGKADLMREMAFENINRRKEGLPEKEFSDTLHKRAYMESYKSSLSIVKYLSQFAPVITIYGNVEYSNDDVRELSLDIGKDLPFLTDDLKKLKRVRVLNNRIARVGDIRIGGLEFFVDTNWVQEFTPSSYKEHMKSAKKQTDKARGIMKWFNKLDILLCHQPPYGLLDKVSSPHAPPQWKGKHAGSKPILSYIKKKKPKYVFCGHIHEGEGKKKVGPTTIFNLGVAGHVFVEL